MKLKQLFRHYRNDDIPSGAEHNNNGVLIKQNTHYCVPPGTQREPNECKFISEYNHGYDKNLSVGDKWICSICNRVWVIKLLFEESSYLRWFPDENTHT
jgi:hypothetical protein